MFKVGQKVWCLIYGHGVIAEILHLCEGTYPVEVKFNDDFTVFYTADGKYHDEGNVTLYPHPVEVVKSLTKPSIDWSHVSEDFQYLAMDSGGLHHLFTEKPEPTAEEWTTHVLYIYAEHFASFSAGTCHWRDSLVKRPD